MCLTRLLPVVTADDEVIVADSASDDDSVARTAEQHGVRVVRCDRPGASLARNAGWRAAERDVVAFIDDDVIVTPGWLDELVAAFGDGVGFATGRTEVPDGTPLEHEPVSVSVWEPPTVIRRGQRGVYGASNNLAVPRDVLERVGGFDERLGPATWFESGEDLELLDRILDLGLVGRYVADAVVGHTQWRSPAQRRRLQWAYGKGSGARVAAIARRDRALAWSLRDEVIRVSGFGAVARRLRRGTRVDHEPAGVDAPSDVSGWAGPLLWRVGALSGFAAGCVRLSPARRGPATPSP